MKYRPDIDVLRALAVVIVILYHFQVPTFSGGFVGVDVFFVISGFLVTSILKAEFEDHGAIRFGAFFARRFWRLFPALAVTIVAAWLAAILVFSPFYLTRFGAEVVSAFTGSSNFLFWVEAATDNGYFDTDGIFKPLLHTWSLSLEAQFYLIWPFALAAVMGLSAKRWVVVLAMILLGGASLWLSAVFSSGTPGSFFLLHTRIYEFLLGAIVVCFPKPQLPKLPATALFLSCVGGVIIIATQYDAAMVFPGSAAIWPCLATAICIWCGQNSVFGGWSKANILVGVGLLSYSLYLVHWPLVVFWAYTFGREFGATDMALLAALTVSLATGLHFLVEKRYRKGLNLGEWHRIAAAAVAVLVLIVPASALHAHQFGGWGWRLDAEARELAESIDYQNYTLVEPCHQWYRELNEEAESALRECVEQAGPAVLVLGDSHGADLVGAFAANSSHPNIFAIARGGCRAHSDREPCQYAAILQFIRDNPELFAAAIYTQSGTYFLEGEQRTLPVLTGRIDAVIRYLAEVSRMIPTIWVGPQWEHNIDLQKGITSVGWLSTELSSKNNGFVRDVDRELARRTENTGIEYVSKIEILGDMSVEHLIHDGAFTYSDTDHWSGVGEVVFGRLLIENSEPLSRLLGGITTESAHEDPNLADANEVRSAQ